MSNPVRPRRARIAFAGVALALTLAMPMIANADTTGGGGAPGGATLTIAPTVRVLNKVVAVVHVAFTCDVLQLVDWNTGEIVPTTAGVLQQADAQVWQASGRSIAGGSTFAGSALAVTCDGATVNAIDISVPTISVPYKPGSAAAAADLVVTDANMTAGESGSTSAVAVKLVTR